jgi:fumarate reductase subunit D
LKGIRESVAALVVIVIVLVTLALPYALTEAYGLNTKKLILLMQLGFLTVFSAGLLIWWVARYRQTSHEIETLREEIRRKIHGRSKCEHDACE